MIIASHGIKPNENGTPEQKHAATMTSAFTPEQTIRLERTGDDLMGANENASLVGGSFSLNSFAAPAALLAVPFFSAKNDYGIVIFPQGVYQLSAVVLGGLLSVLILEVAYEAYKRCFGIGSYSGEVLPTRTASGTFSKWKDFIAQVGQRNLILEAVVLGSLIYLFYPHLAGLFTAISE
jgi:hypothetical protein